jgi:nucleotide-binding universal stress UspA family protein
LGSTTEGVLRAATVPVLAVTAAMSEPPEGLFATLLVAVDESDPADAAAATAARIAQALGSRCVLCNVVDTRALYDKALTYGYDPTAFAEEMRGHARGVVDRARAHGGFAPSASSTVVPEGEPAAGIIAAATEARADVIVMGSHGRRGLQRLFLGSVAEHVVRHSPVPVLVVRN